MLKVSLVSCLAVFSVCECNFTFIFQDYRRYKLNETCAKNGENTTIINYRTVVRVRVSPKVQFKNNHGPSFNIFAAWKKFPLDIFANSTNISLKCQKELNDYYKAVLNNELYALKILDASAKLPSGLLNGNVNQYGDFDECMEVPSAQYCLAEIDIASMWVKSLVNYKDLVHSHFTIKETFDDPGHRVPGFSFIRWGFCIPKGCSSADLINVLNEKLQVKANIRPGLCQHSVKLKANLTFGDYFARFYFGILIFTVGICTFLYQRMYPFQIGSKTFQIIRSFSLQYNYSQLTKISENKNELNSIHGVRGLSALSLLMAHKAMALMYDPYINRTFMTEIQSMKWTVIGRNAIVYTDCFLLISGLLSANAVFMDLDKKNYQVIFKQRILNRLFRILPNLITVILFCTYILPSLGSGPLWPLVVNHHSSLCKKYMWRNIFLVHNYFGFENMCLTHTHQLGIDTQLFLVTPIFVYLLWKFKSRGLCVVAFVALISSVLRFWKTLEHSLSYVVHFGIPISRMFNTATYSYILPTHRATVYLIGIVLAYYLRNVDKRPLLSKKQKIFFWAIAYTIGLSTWFGPVNMSVIGYEYDRFQAAIYAALSPITWGMAVAWVIYTIERGIQSWFTPILTWRYFQIFTKLAYSVYLVQFPVFFYNVGITRHVREFKNYMLLPPVETGIILLISTVLTLCVEMPFHNLYKIFLSNK